jgi:ATP-dependent RNA helicase RhlE
MKEADEAQLSKDDVRLTWSPQNGNRKLKVFEKFADLYMPPEYVRRKMDDLKLHKLTSIQIPAVLMCDADVVGLAKTGSGKTFAFLLPLIVYLKANPTEKALLICPTRELAEQTYMEFEKLLEHSTEGCICLFHPFHILL